MAFSIKEWLNLPAKATKINAAALQDMEARLAAYTDALAATKGVANGLGSLDGTGHQPISESPLSVVSDSRAVAAGDLLIAKTVGEALKFERIAKGAAGQQMIVRSDGTVAYEDATRISVKAWGATGLNTGNDGPAIKLADEAAAAKGGAIVWFPPAIGYRSTEHLRPSSGNTWEGAGTGSYINLVDTGTAESISVYLHEVSNAKIRNLKIEQANAASRTGVYGLIRIEGCTGIEIQGNYLGKSTATGVWNGRGVTDIKIWGNTVVGTEADGIHTNREARRVRIWANYVKNAGDDAISTADYKEPEGFHGEVPWGYCEDIVIWGNNIEGGKARGIALYSGHGTAAYGNAIKGCEKGGIIVTANTDALPLSGKTYFPVGVIIANNTIRDVTFHGISLTKGSRDVSITGNRIYNPSKSGIFLGEVAVGVVITNNRITRCTDRGILVEPTSSTEARLLEELFTNLGETAPASVGMQDLTISSNALRKSGEESIRLIGEAAHHITNVTCIGNHTDNQVTETWPQILMKYVDDFVVVGNQMAPGNYRGLQLENCTKGTVAGNDAHGQLNAEYAKAALSEVVVQGNSFPGGTELVTETFEPAYNNLLGESFADCIATASAGTVLSGQGTVHFARVKVQKSCTIKNVILCVTSGGVALKAGECFAALFNEAGELLSTTASQHEAWLSNGVKTMALAVAQEVPAGYHIVAFFANATTTLPSFIRGNNFTFGSTGLAGLNVRFGTANTGRTTTMPAKLESAAADANSWAAAVS